MRLKLKNGKIASQKEQEETEKTVLSADCAALISLDRITMNTVTWSEAFNAADKLQRLSYRLPAVTQRLLARKFAWFIFIQGLKYDLWAQVIRPFCTLLNPRWRK